MFLENDNNQVCNSNYKNEMFNDYKKKEIDKVFQTISPIINSYMEKNSVKILFDAKNIFMARNDLNFTNDILEAINKVAK